MSVQSADGRWVVRWRDAFGRQRGRRFQTEQSAKEFDAAIHDVAQQERRGVGGARPGGAWAYSTKTGTRWYFKTRASNGAQLTRRGFSSQKAASDAKRRLVEQIERREIRHTKATFGEHWQIWLKSRKPHLQHGTWRSYEIIGRKRLLPAFESRPLARLPIEHVRAGMGEQARVVAAGRTAPKTANNTRGTLVACLNAAVHDRGAGRAHAEGTEGHESTGPNQSRKTSTAHSALIHLALLLKFIRWPSRETPPVRLGPARR